MAIDSYIEMNKYNSFKDINADNLNTYPSSNDHNNMKLFRAQRNTYLTIFTLFVGIVNYRTLLFISQINNLNKSL